ncbi:MAG: ANTAR domain-containing protein [Streptosporangiales bacterium]|jgi:hypothetical protein|nr:ANTAR domain-containing protein [Streptosporangiales bacterium]
MGNSDHGTFGESVYLHNISEHQSSSLALAAVCLLLHRQLQRSLRELEESQRLAGQLQAALDSRVVIEQAKGAVSARLGISPGAAFGLLRSYARSRSRPLRQLAGDVVGGSVPVTALTGDPVSSG